MTTCNIGLGHLIAKNEDEYVQLALQLASDITALSTLRMSLRELMAKSPVCDGANFTLSLESTYRNMWERYCKGDVPSLRRIEMLQQQQGFCEESHAKNTEPNKVPKEESLGTIKSNGFGPVPSSLMNSFTCEENGSQSNKSIESGNLS